MNYQSIYENLISTRQQLKRHKDDTYYEKHHIIPKCLGGTNSKSNIVLLTFKEHYIAHLLLIETNTGVNKSKMVFALWQMCIDTNNNRIISANQYEKIRTLYVSDLKNQYASGLKLPPMKNKKHSDETKNKIKTSKTGKKLPGANKTKTITRLLTNNPMFKEENRKKVSEKLKAYHAAKRNKE
jgi:hypothetical protein